MFPFLQRIAFAAAAALFVPVALSAQEAPAAPPADSAAAAPPEAEVEAWYAELQGLHQQLESIQQQALADPQLSSVQESLGAEIRAAMAASDPAMEEQLERMNTLQQEASAASAAGDNARLQTLMVEASDIQNRFMELQQQVLVQPEIAAKLLTFQSQLQAKMIEVDPGAQGLMDRFRDLETRLANALGGG